MRISEKIYRLRTENDLTQVDFGKIAGVSDKAVSTWELGLKSPRMKALQKICSHFNIDINAFADPDSEIYNDSASVEQRFRPPDNIMPMPKTYKIPLLGTIACGEPILAAENIEDEVEIPEHIHADFALRCKGDSMINARIHDGDIVYIRQQPAVNNGEIAAVLIGDEATLKRVYVHSDHVVLQPENPSFDPLVYFGDAMEQIRVLGKAVGFTSLLP